VHLSSGQFSQTRVEPLAPVLRCESKLQRTMQLRAKCALLVLLFCVAVTAVMGQRAGGSKGVYRASGADAELQREAAGLHPLTLDEGLAILSAALDSRHNAGFSSDCSHFVHGLYERAGFSYAYAPSRDLYEGIDEFRRVTNPQPGDLAVWHGHAGIVVNPVQHSFFSLLRTGPGVESYDSPYWKRRGRARFFRYIKAGATDMASLRTANMTLNHAEQDEPADPSESDALQESSGRTLATFKPAASLSAETIIPHVPVVHSIHPKPIQVDEAFLQSCADSEGDLLGRDLFRSTQPVIVFDHFAAGKVHIDGNAGWAEVEIDEVLFFVDGKAQARQGSERLTWPLTRRDQTSWELRPPPDAIYVPQAIAAHIMARQLAQLTHDRPNPARLQQKAELVRVLDSLPPE
jgi:hypothetical protein